MKDIGEEGFPADAYKYGGHDIKAMSKQR